ncbi:MAG TPA: hypothetical protein VGF94_29120 [Kofleriaceae bacterium]|jgi:signal transduction histidine kinase
MTAREQLLDRLRLLERAVARAAFAERAAELIRSRTHELGNHLQVVKLSSLVLENRCTAPGSADVARELRASAERAAELLNELLAAARPEERAAGPAALPLIRHALELARPLFGDGVDFVADLPDDACTRAARDELEGIVLAAALGSLEPRLHVELRQRSVARAPWLQLLVHGARRTDYDDLLDGLTELAGGELSISPGRSGTELALELPLA